MRGGRPTIYSILKVYKNATPPRTAAPRSPQPTVAPDEAPFPPVADVAAAAPEPEPVAVPDPDSVAEAGGAVPDVEEEDESLLLLPPWPCVSLAKVYSFAGRASAVTPVPLTHEAGSAGADSEKVMSAHCFGRDHQLMKSSRKKRV